MNKTGNFYPCKKTRSSKSDSVSLVLTRTITFKGEVTYQAPAHDARRLGKPIRSGVYYFRQGRISCTEVMEEKISRAPLVL